MAGPIIGIASAALPLWFMVQSTRGNHRLWSERFHEQHAKEELEYARDAFGNDSGQPAMDGWKLRLKELLAFGPNGIVTAYHRSHAYTSGFINDVILNNLAPIAIGIVGIYAGFGTAAVNGVFRNIGRALMPAVNGINWSRGGTAALNGIGRAIAAPFRALGWSLTNGRARFSLPMMALAAFGLHRFRRVWNEDEQQDHFRYITSGVDHH